MNKYDRKDRNNKIRYLFEDCGFSTNQIAQLVDISQRTIQMIIKDNNYQKGHINQEVLDSYVEQLQEKDIAPIFVYLYDFGDNICYIGTTGDILARISNHHSLAKTKSHYCEYFNMIDDLKIFIERPKILYFSARGSRAMAFKYETYYQNYYKELGYVVLGTNERSDLLCPN